MFWSRVGFRNGRGSGLSLGTVLTGLSTVDPKDGRPGGRRVAWWPEAGGTGALSSPPVSVDAEQEATRAPTTVAHCYEPGGNTTWWLEATAGAKLLRSTCVPSVGWQLAVLCPGCPPVRPVPWLSSHCPALQVNVQHWVIGTELEYCLCSEQQPV